MPTDLTPFFKARGKTIAQRKSKEQATRCDVQNISEEPSLAYRGTSRFASKIAQEIHDFGHAILAKRREYLDFNATIPTMTNHDRDLFDKDSEKGLRSISELIYNLLEKISNEKTLSNQEKEHLKAVCGLLERDVKKIGRAVTEMRGLRLTSMAKRREMSRLSAMVIAKDRKHRGSTPMGEASRSLDEQPKKQTEIRRRTAPDNSSSKEIEPLIKNTRKENLVAIRDAEAEEPELDLPPEKISQLQKENEKLFKKFTSSQDTVNSLETQIFEIQRLQETFSDKVFDQEKEIEILNEAAVNTTENIRDGNEWIRQAISNSAGRRVVLLFCIVVLTFTLLFLDWYNP